MSDIKTMIWADFLRECATTHEGDVMLMPAGAVLRCALVVSL